MAEARKLSCPFGRHTPIKVTCGKISPAASLTPVHFSAQHLPCSRLSVVGEKNGRARENRAGTEEAGTRSLKSYIYHFLFVLFFFSVIPGSLSSPAPGKPRPLPCLTTNFIGREEDVEKIITKLQTDRLRMIMIISPPGMGKTQLSIRVSHLIKIREPALSVIYVERLDKLIDICGEILDRLRNRSWSTSDDLISQAKRKLLEVEKDTVIVLDNTEDVQGKEFDDFAEWLVKSVPKVQLIITSRQDVGFVSAGVHKVRLGPLDATLSAELLRKLDVSCSEKQVEDLGELCGGIPLLLINCACLLKDGFNPEVLIQELSNNPIGLLKSNLEEIYDALGRFVHNFSEDLIRNLVVLSVFPSTFAPKDIEFFFEDQLHLETVKTKMLKRTLLQQMNDQKLGLHPLLQAYCRTERESLHMVDVGCNAQRKFNQHYLELLKSLSKTFITKNSASIAIQTLRDQKVNFIEALKSCFDDASEIDQKELALDVVNSAEVLDLVAKVLSPPKECAELYRKCCDIAKTSGDKKRHAESLNSLGFRRLCDVAHSKDEPEDSRVTLQLFQEAHDIRKTMPEEDQKCQTHAHTISKLGLCHVLQVTVSLVFVGSGEKPSCKNGKFRHIITGAKKRTLDMTKDTMIPWSGHVISVAQIGNRANCGNECSVSLLLIYNSFSISSRAIKKRAAI